MWKNWKNALPLTRSEIRVIITRARTIPIFQAINPRILNLPSAGVPWVNRRRGKTDEPSAFRRLIQSHFFPLNAYPQPDQQSQFHSEAVDRCRLPPTRTKQREGEVKCKNKFC